MWYFVTAAWGKLIHNYSTLAVIMLEFEHNVLVLYCTANYYRFSCLKQHSSILSQFCRSDIQGGLKLRFFCLGSHQAEINMLAILGSYLEAQGGIAPIGLAHQTNLPILRSPH